MDSLLLILLYERESGCLDVGKAIRVNVILLSLTTIKLIIIFTTMNGVILEHV